MRLVTARDAEPDTSKRLDRDNEATKRAKQAVLLESRLAQQHYTTPGPVQQLAGPSGRGRRGPCTPSEGLLWPAERPLREKHLFARASRLKATQQPEALQPETGNWERRDQTTKFQPRTGDGEFTRDMRGTITKSQDMNV
ncbi:Uncharacterized protein HZ326_2494 [Fusarium oxysporum f. sp. albedinis]|nr:Uncharacterized protein HZ326_2494 [Fusarium oxysporum f. sp. albedinis]